MEAKKKQDFYGKKKEETIDEIVERKGYVPRWYHDYHFDKVFQPERFEGVSLSEYKGDWKVARTLQQMPAAQAIIDYPTPPDSEEDEAPLDVYNEHDFDSDDYDADTQPLE